MSIVEQVGAQLKDAMRAKDKPRTAALRNIRAAFLSEMKEDNSSTLSDDRAVEVLRRQEKQRKESIEAYTQAGRDDLVSAEQAELEVVQEFLPRLADEATTREWVKQAIASSGASGRGEMGKVMGALMKAHKGEIDGKLANRIAAELLG